MLKESLHIRKGYLDLPQMEYGCFGVCIIKKTLSIKRYKPSVNSGKFKNLRGNR